MAFGAAGLTIGRVALFRDKEIGCEPLAPPTPGPTPWIGLLPGAIYYC